MAGMSQICNHIVAALFRIESAVRNGLTNPACTSKPNQWLPGGKSVGDIPANIKDLKFERDNFGTRGKKKENVDHLEKRNFQPINSDV